MTDQNTRPTPSSDVAALIEQINSLLACNNTGQVSHRLPGLAIELLQRSVASLSAPAQVEVTDEQIIELACTKSNHKEHELSLVHGLMEFEVFSHARIVEFARELLALTATDAKPTYPKTIDCRSPVEHAIVEYHLVDNLAGEAEKMGRHSAIRGLMVRLGMYDEFVRALEAGDDYEPPLQDAKPASSGTIIDMPPHGEQNTSANICVKPERWPLASEGKTDA